MKIFLPFKKKKPRHALTLRIIHWTYAPAVLASILSGLYINRPSKIFGFKNMDTARKTHFIAQFMLIFAYLARVYYAFQDKNYKEILFNRRSMRELPRFARYELFLTDKKPQYPKYNPGQKLLFTSFAFVLPIQMLTGLALYYSSFWQKTAQFSNKLNYLRQAHFLTALINTILLVSHLYFVFAHGFRFLKSIFTGYK